MGKGQVAHGRLKQNHHELNAFQGHMASDYLGGKSIKIPHIEVIEKLQFFTANENENMTKVF